jgi:hypothetical protein
MVSRRGFVATNVAVLSLWPEIGYTKVVGRNVGGRESNVSDRWMKVAARSGQSSHNECRVPPANF